MYRKPGHFVPFTAENDRFRLNPAGDKLSIGETAAVAGVGAALSIGAKVAADAATGDELPWLPVIGIGTLLYVIGVKIGNNRPEGGWGGE